MGFPPITAPGFDVQEVTYTTLADLTQATPGTRRLNGSGVIDATFAAVDPGNGPSGGTLTCRVFLNAVFVATCIIADGDETGLAALGSPVPYVDGDTLAYGTITNSGAATGPANFGVHLIPDM